MRRLLRAFLVSLALVASLGSTACRPADAAVYSYVRPYRATAKNQAAVIWTIGDSITHGAIPVPNGAGSWTYNYVGGWRRYVYAALVALGRTPTMVGGIANASDGLPLSIAGTSHNGNNGSSTAQWVSTFYAAYQAGLSSTPTIITISTGANDADSVASGQAVGALADLAIASYPAANILVATVSPQGPLGTSVATTNAQIVIEVANRRRAGKHIQLVDQASAIRAGNVPDTQHPDGNGYSKLGDLWLQAIVPLAGP